MLEFWSEEGRVGCSFVIFCVDILTSNQIHSIPQAALHMFNLESTESHPKNLYCCTLGKRMCWKYRSTGRE